MKRLVCVLFLVIMICIGVVFQDKEINVCDCFKPLSISVISDKYIDKDYVCNGDKYITKISDINYINFNQIDGITFIVEGLDVKEFIGYIGLRNYRKYAIGDSYIIEGNCYKNLNLNFESVQIAVNDNLVVIGFPMILNSF